MRGSRPSWIACWVTEKAPVITAWLAMTVAMVARMTSGSRRPVGRHQEERIGDRFRRLQHQRALAEIVQREGREHHADPGGLDRPAAKMTHVGIERLGTGTARNTLPSTTKPMLPCEVRNANRVHAD